MSLLHKAKAATYPFPPHKREYEDCKQILKLSPSHAARSRYSPPVCHDSIPGHQVSNQRFWENRWIPDSLPTSPRPRRKPPHVEPTLIKVKRHLPSCQSEFVKKATIHNSLRSVKQTAVWRLKPFPLRSKVIRLQLAMPLGPHRGRMIAFATAVRSGPSSFVAREINIIQGFIV